MAVVLMGQGSCHEDAQDWVAVKEVKLSHHNPETVLLTIDPHNNQVKFLIATQQEAKHPGGAPKGIIYDHQHLLHGAWFWAQD